VVWVSRKGLSFEGFLMRLLRRLRENTQDYSGHEENVKTQKSREWICPNMGLCSGSMCDTRTGITVTRPVCVSDLMGVRMRALRYLLIAIALLAPILLVVLIGSVSTSPPDEATLLRIKVLEDDRYLENWELARYTKDPNPQVRLAAVSALGRIGREEGGVNLVRALEDPDGDVRAAAAFGIGLLDDSTRTGGLLRALEDPVHGVRASVVEALGKVGNYKVTQRLLDMLDSPSPELRGEIALALGRLEDPTAIEPLMRLLEKDPESGVRWKAAWALEKFHEDHVTQALVRALEDKDPMVAVLASRGLQKRGEGFEWEAVLPALKHPDWRVQVNVLMAIGNSSDSLAVPSVLESLDSPNHHVRTAACLILGDLKGWQAVEALKERLDDPSPDVRGEAVNALARIGGRRVFSDVTSRTEDSERYVRVRAHEALGHLQLPKSVAFLVPRLKDPDSRIRSAAAKGLSTLRQKGSTEALVGALEDPDWVVVAVAAEGLGTLRSRGSIPALKKTFHSFSGTTLQDAEVRLAVITAFRKMAAFGVEPIYRAALEDPDIRVRRLAGDILQEKGETAVKIAPAVYGDGSRDGSGLAMGLGERRIRIETSRGHIICVLHGDDAPETVANFLRLAGEGFYDGLTFHRVVPNFVIQGGCPRGDGWGDPGYTIRCEINRHRYLTGTLGMALSGKDTGGSQFFITHSPQPHLDGLYTVFGRVLEGQDVVEAIVQGDEILAIVEM